ncbi:Protein of unknown function [Pyronema omphalodes CBS 100304]|uniref:RanBP2-type domain-containing protein n=1 Tax=Pyronema omphalodes (strain CBS 100304) TaxID=1076935 RepID=U4LC82_PYROM|nr:Protein of unknown function [Pyronema omphalodes CBS 100304]
MHPEYIPGLDDAWKCKNCMTMNSGPATICHCCGEAKPGTEPSRAGASAPTPDSSQSQV